MSKKNFQKQAAQKAKQLKKQAKKNRQKHDPLKWEEKKRKKQFSQNKKWNIQYSDVNPECSLPLSQFPSKKNCKDCILQCKYNSN